MNSYAAGFCLNAGSSLQSSKQCAKYLLWNNHTDVYLVHDEITKSLILVIEENDMDYIQIYALSQYGEPKTLLSGNVVAIDWFDDENTEGADTLELFGLKKSQKVDGYTY